MTSMATTSMATASLATSFAVVVLGLGLNRNIIGWGFVTRDKSNQVGSATVIVKEVFIT